jgi:hypothetical protein
MWHTSSEGVSRRLGVDNTHTDSRITPGSPHIQDYVVAGPNDLTTQQASRAILLDSERALVPESNSYIQHADTTLQTDFDAMVFTNTNDSGWSHAADDFDSL